MQRRKLIPVLVLVVGGAALIGLSVAMSGCATAEIGSPPGDQAAALRASLTRLAEAYSVAGEAQAKDAERRLEDASRQLADSDPTNDIRAELNADRARKDRARAERVLQVAALTAAALKNPGEALTQLAAMIRDPNVGGLVVWIMGEVSDWQKAEAAAEAAKVRPAP